MTIKIFKVSEEEWYAGETEEAAIACLLETWGGHTRESAIEEGILVLPVVELAEDELARLKIRVELAEDEIGEDGEGDEKRTFAEHLAQLIADGEDFPCAFASTEF